MRGVLPVEESMLLNVIITWCTCAAQLSYSVALVVGIELVLLSRVWFLFLAFIMSRGHKRPRKILDHSLP